MAGMSLGQGDKYLSGVGEVRLPLLGLGLIRAARRCQKGFAWMSVLIFLAVSSVLPPSLPFSALVSNSCVSVSHVR